MLFNIDCKRLIDESFVMNVPVTSQDEDLIDRYFKKEKLTDEQKDTVATLLDEITDYLLDLVDYTPDIEVTQISTWGDNYLVFENDEDIYLGC